MSTPINDGGPAFPAIDHYAQVRGMTLRDYFAGQALAGLISRTEGGRTVDFAVLAYDAADQMIILREKRT